MPQSLLNTLQSPADLRRLSRGELGRLANELRDFVIHSEIGRASCRERV